jgi:hypothetical protein
MPERRGSRFVVEALFLAALTVALALAHLDALQIVSAMALGWLVMTLIEWLASRREPHYGSGLPPRYYLPTVELPPAKPLEQVGEGYPKGGRDDAPTWIASAAVRAELLGEWPRVSVTEVEEEQQEAVFVSRRERDVDPWTVAAPPSEPIEPAAVSARREAPRSAAGRRIARHTLDPLGDGSPRKRFARGSASPETIEVEALPGSRRLPGEAR